MAARHVGTCAHTVPRARNSATEIGRSAGGGGAGGAGLPCLCVPRRRPNAAGEGLMDTAARKAPPGRAGRGVSSQRLAYASRSMDRVADTRAAGRTERIEPGQLEGQDVVNSVDGPRQDWEDWTRLNEPS